MQSLKNVGSIYNNHGNKSSSLNRGLWFFTIQLYSQPPPQRYNASICTFSLGETTVRYNIIDVAWPLQEICDILLYLSCCQLLK